jgi:hypothetical protein
MLFCTVIVLDWCMGLSMPVKGEGLYSCQWVDMSAGQSACQLDERGSHLTFYFGQHWMIFPMLLNLVEVQDCSCALISCTDQFHLHSPLQVRRSALKISLHMLLECGSPGVQQQFKTKTLAYTLLT